MRYLAILLLTPWLLILCWAYWAYPKYPTSNPRRRVFDAVVTLLAIVLAVQAALLGFDTVKLPATNEFGVISGGIWQQVLPALYGYGACVAVLALALLFRQRIWRRR